jgi:hypothetical protein
MKLMKFKILNFFLHLYFGWSVCKPEYTSHEVYSLWGRVEKMLFRPIGKKQNSLSFNKVCQWLATGRWFPPQYSWNIVESGVYHHQANKQMLFFRLTSVKISFSKVSNTIGYPINHMKDYYGKKTEICIHC